MRYTVVASVVRVIGTIWMPAATCAMDYTLSSGDLENARDDDGKLTRDSVELWLDTHAGDFQHIIDFEADLADGDVDVVIPWATEEGELTYIDCMFPPEE